MSNQLTYPIKFRPILQEKIWGGEKLKKLLYKDTTTSNIGESWEISGVKENISEVSNGTLKGKNIEELITSYKNELVGKHIYQTFKNKFPLLFKFIDANDNLSIQLHPDDKLAKKRHNSFGKTEMWYVLDTDENAKIYAGFKEKINKEKYESKFQEGKILETIHIDKALKGDSFFIEAGTIHAIGKGVLIAEIQQNSDTTYRIYDWGRKDMNGNYRELHTNLALEALNFNKVGSCKLNYTNLENTTNKIYACKYFTTNKIIVNGRFLQDVSTIDSFIVYMCVAGNAIIGINGNEEKIEKGETILIPAITKKVSIKSSEKGELLEVYIKQG